MYLSNRLVLLLLLLGTLNGFGIIEQWIAKEIGAINCRGDHWRIFRIISKYNTVLIAQNEKRRITQSMRF